LGKDLPDRPHPIGGLLSRGGIGQRNHSKRLRPVLRLRKKALRGAVDRSRAIALHLQLEGSAADSKHTSGGPRIPDCDGRTDSRSNRRERRIQTCTLRVRSRQACTEPDVSSEFGR
jgi:hypothetical protein